MKSLLPAALAALLVLPAHAMPPAQGSGGMPGKPAGHPTAPASPKMPITSSNAQRIVWSCTAGQLGSIPVMVNFAEKKALSTRASKMSDAKIAGDVASWTETEKDGTLAFVVDRRTGELQVTQTPAKGKPVVHRGQCGAPDPNRKGGH